MKIHKYIPFFFIICFLYFPLLAYPQGREEIPFNKAWNFHGQSVSGVAIDEMVNLPHSWNTKDAQEGLVYYRGIGKYSKVFELGDSLVGKRIFIRFDGVNITAKVVLNGKELGEHKGGYAAFIFELTDLIKFDGENKIEVIVSNEANLEVIPLVGDFNNYGGIYRPVNLIVTDPVCITPLDFASPGIYIKQKNVSEKSADIEVLTKISNGSNESATITCVTTIFEGDSAVGIGILEEERNFPKGDSEEVHAFTIPNPHLWNGKQDPFLYHVKVELLKDGKLIDSKIEPLGLRYFHADANEGFFLNGKPIDLRGVSRHQDRQDKASAISQDDHIEDMEIMLDLGINAIRLAHYQHAEIIYNMADTAGLMVWAEIPWVGMPSGFMSATNGYENTKGFRNNAKNQLYELIRQNFNHPSILMWSIFNEIQNPEGQEPTDFVKELNEIVKKEDPSRMTVGASMVKPEGNANLHEITDLIAWNRYFGWYYNEPKDMGIFLDQLHTDFPEYKIGISEYGAGGSIHQHSDKLMPPNPMGTPHPEEWQSYYHEENLKIFDERPFVWGTFVWNMFDFGSHFRKEGDHHGINDKGLVTYDRKVKKDAFYFYKANWSEKPVLHISSSRYIFRDKPKTNVKVYTNLTDIKLQINGKDYPVKSPEKGIVVWDSIVLEKGNNGIVVTAMKNGRTYSDNCVWVLENPYSGMNLFVKIFDFMMIAYQVAIGGLIIALLIWLFGIRTTKRRAKFKRFLLWTVFLIFFLGSTLILLIKFFLPKLMGG